MGVFDREPRNTSAAIMSDMGGGMHPRISIRGGQFHLIDAGGQRYGAPIILKNTPQGQKVVMLAVIIGSNPKKSRVFYDQAYDPDNPGPPDCYSDNGVAPSVGASSPMARTCAECQFSKWGSDYSQLTNKKTKACSEKKKIALLVVGDQTRLAYELQVPPATLKNLATYAGLTASHSPPGSGRKADIGDFVTEISFKPDSTGVLEFNAHCWLSSVYTGEDQALHVTYNPSGQPVAAADEGDSVGDLINEIWEAKELDDLLGLNDQPWQPPAGFVGPGMQPLAVQGPRHAPTTQALPVNGPGGPYAPPAGVAPQVAHQPFASAPASAPSPVQTPAAPAAAAPRTRKRRTDPAGAPQQQLPAPAAPAANTAPFLQPQQQQAQPSTQQTGLPDFLQRPQQGAAAPAGNGASFGMAEAPPPPTSMEGALNTALNLSTKR